MSRELRDLGPVQPYRPRHRGATVTALLSSGPPAPRRPVGAVLAAAAAPPRKRRRVSDFWERVGSPETALAPLVDQSLLAFRLLCRRRGARICSTPMIDSGRFVADAAYRVSQFEDGAGAAEDRPLIVQFRGDDGATLAEAAALVADRCDAVEINCGCPQRVAKRGHFGAYLLDEPDLVCALVAALRASLPPRVAVAVKLRLLEAGAAATGRLAARLEGAGCGLLTVHGRTRAQKKCGHACDLAAIATVRASVAIPVVANGGVECAGDLRRVRDATGCAAAMSGELALECPGVFAGETPTAAGQRAAARDYLALAAVHDPGLAIVKLHLEKMLHGFGAAAVARVRAAASPADLAAAVDAADGETLVPRSWYLRHRASGAEVRAFLAAHPDATELADGRVRCDPTGHEIAPRLGELRAHWGGRRYRFATRKPT